MILIVSTLTLCKGDIAMADMIDYHIYGDNMQLVEIELDPGEGVRGLMNRLVNSIISLPVYPIISSFIF
jgi:hypothetical protein